jgi:hypothetical protein
MAATGSAQWRLAWVLGALVFGVADLVARKERLARKLTVQPKPAPHPEELIKPPASGK